MTLLLLREVPPSQEGESGRPPKPVTALRTQARTTIRKRARNTMEKHIARLMDFCRCCTYFLAVRERAGSVTSEHLRIGFSRDSKSRQKREAPIKRY
ncbi:hypothetical protein AVEN_260264-1 [Araneus ventricosus]|uniref:Uncharacterized protein n=1 Tax=Araneus ventricosus TaxID=182803 RepID=A0A4Y2FKT7_ARAVE|nr:hypothetical protein AVEN_260264-1 [Araneus ventricosus]